MRHLDYVFDITAAGIQFIDAGKDTLKSPYIQPGTVLVTELDAQGRMFLRITNPNTLDYHLGDIEPYELI